MTSNVPVISVLPVPPATENLVAAFAPTLNPVPTNKSAPTVAPPVTINAAFADRFAGLVELTAFKKLLDVIIPVTSKVEPTSNVPRIEALLPFTFKFPWVIMLPFVPRTTK